MYSNSKQNLFTGLISSKIIQNTTEILCNSITNLLFVYTIPFTTYLSETDPKNSLLMVSIRKKSFDL